MFVINVIISDRIPDVKRQNAKSQNFWSFPHREHADFPHEKSTMRIFRIVPVFTALSLPDNPVHTMQDPCLPAFPYK
jgi:hypothetical protein